MTALTAFVLFSIYKESSAANENDTYAQKVRIIQYY